MWQLAPDIRIAYMGRKGSQSHLAAKNCFQHNQLVGCPSFDDVVNNVAHGQVELGMLAIESLAAGRVDPVHHLLANMDTHIVGEYFHPVRHHLMARQDQNMAHIKMVISHPQALMQCRQYISVRDWQMMEASDTSTAAYQVSNSDDPSLAAICTKEAGTLNRLKMLHADIQDNTINATVFLIISANPTDDLFDAGVPQISTLLVTIDNETSSLHRVLGCFAEQNIDIVKFESYISSKPSDSAKVLLSLKGNVNEDNYLTALDQLSRIAKDHRILGTYSAAPERLMSPHEFSNFMTRDDAGNSAKQA